MGGITSPNRSHRVTSGLPTKARGADPRVRPSGRHMGRPTLLAPFLSAAGVDGVARRVRRRDERLSLADLERAGPAPVVRQQPNAVLAGLLNADHFAVVEHVG